VVPTGKPLGNAQITQTPARQMVGNYAAQFPFFFFEALRFLFHLLKANEPRKIFKPSAVLLLILLFTVILLLAKHKQLQRSLKGTHAQDFIVLFFTFFWRHSMMDKSDVQNF
jgi:hypothetical protein